jgi:bifunctional N-acetylglucosamine-1-phosphate-uridyltransferase/glucosamine-1-phosphate-acetyltransferase GlmU-like protein
MGVTVQTSLWIAVGSIVTSEVPDDQSLVSRSREEHVGAAVTLASLARRVVESRTFREM